MEFLLGLGFCLVNFSLTNYSIKLNSNSQTLNALNDNLSNALKFNQH